MVIDPKLVRHSPSRRILGLLKSTDPCFCPALAATFQKCKSGALRVDRKSISRMCRHTADWLQLLVLYACFLFDIPDGLSHILARLQAQHLAHWGINMMSMQKTEKTMTELQIDLNMAFEADRITEAGSMLQPLSGPG